MSVALDLLSVKLAILLHHGPNHKLNEHLLTRVARRCLNYLFFRGLVVVFAPQETLEHIGVHPELLSDFGRKGLQGECPVITSGCKGNITLFRTVEVFLLLQFDLVISVGLLL